jgi:hypothetical protein
MRKLVAVLAAALISTVATPMASADAPGGTLDTSAVDLSPTTAGDLTDSFVSSALSDVSAWDPEFAALAPDPQPGGHDLLAGSQKVTDASGFQHVRVSAHSGPLGQDPTGEIRVTFDSTLLPGTTADVRGDVDCLSVTGNVARVAALLRQPFMGNTHVTLIVFDNGNPGVAMGQSPDFGFIDFTSTPSPICAFFGLTLLGDMTGNYVVRDAS